MRPSAGEAVSGLGLGKRTNTGSSYPRAGAGYNRHHGLGPRRFGAQTVWRPDGLEPRRFGAEAGVAGERRSGAEACPMEPPLRRPPYGDIAEMEGAVVNLLSGGSRATGGTMPERPRRGVPCGGAGGGYAAGRLFL